MNFTLSIPKEKLDLIKNEADRLGVTASGLIKMRTLESIKMLEVSQ